MERLTKFINGQWKASCSSETYRNISLGEFEQIVINTLAEYENTEISPNEIIKLQKENFELKTELGINKEFMTRKDYLELVQTRENERDEYKKENKELRANAFLQEEIIKNNGRPIDKDKIVNLILKNTELEQSFRFMESERDDLKARLEKSVELPVKLGKECYIVKTGTPTIIEKAVPLFPCLATESESGKQIMGFKNVFATEVAAEQALKEREI